MTRARQKGSIIIYILIAIFLTGLLIAGMTQGSKKNASTEQIDEMMLFLQNDVKTIQSFVTECMQGYPGALDINGDGKICSKAADTGCGALPIDNPNPPFPLYCANAACALSTMTNSGAGTPVTNAGCPGAPTGQRMMFNANAGSSFKLLSDTATYTTQYFNDGTEGIYFRITRAASDPLWTEAISRLNNKYSQCSAAAVTAAGTCVNGCFYYWILRLPTSTLGGEVGCP